VRRQRRAASTSTFAASRAFAWRFSDSVVGRNRLRLTVSEDRRAGAWVAGDRPTRRWDKPRRRASARACSRRLPLNVVLSGLWERVFAAR
jgi:hypothetical protein